MLTHNQRKIANAEAARALTKEQEKKDKLFKLHGYLYRYYEGDVIKISQMCNLSTYTVKQKFAGGRAEILKNKGPLTTIEEVEMNKLLEDLPNLELLPFVNKPLFEKYRLRE